MNPIVDTVVNSPVDILVSFDQPVVFTGSPVSTGFSITVNGDAASPVSATATDTGIRLVVPTVLAGDAVSVSYDNAVGFVYDVTSTFPADSFTLASTNYSTVRRSVVGGGFIYIPVPVLEAGVVTATVEIEGTRAFRALVSHFGKRVIDTQLAFSPTIILSGDIEEVGSGTRISAELDIEDPIQAVIAAQEWQRVVADRVVRSFALLREEIIDGIEEIPAELALELGGDTGLLIPGPMGPQGPPGSGGEGCCDIISSDNSLLVTPTADGYDIIINNIIPLEIASFGPSIVAERGQVVSSVALTWAYNEGDTPPDTSQSINNGVGSLPLGDRAFLFSDPITTDTTFTLSASDSVRGNASRNTSVAFRWRVYWGVTTSAVLASSEITSGNSTLSNSRVRDINYDATGGRYFWYAYPTALGDLSTTLTKINGLTFSDWSDGAGGANVTGYSVPVDTVYLSGIAYKVYRSFNLQNGSSIDLEFR